jgi:hypothetical protein
VQDLEMKKRIADEIMAMMDEKDGERLKNHPKFAVNSVEVEKDPMAEAVEPELDGALEPKPEDEEELSPELIAKLLEMVKDQ